MPSHSAPTSHQRVHSSRCSASLRLAMMVVALLSTVPHAVSASARPAFIGPLARPAVAALPATDTVPSVAPMPATQAATATTTYTDTTFAYDFESSLLQPISQLNRARYNHDATVLNNGKVLITDGTIPNQCSIEPELYDPATGTFAAAAKMIWPRVRTTATLLQDGRVLVAGGATYRSAGAIFCGDDSSVAELYDPATGRWTSTGTMRQARYDHTATLLPNGKVLIAGGDSSSSSTSAELYDPATGTFTPTGSMRYARGQHTAVLLADGNVLIVGGDVPGDTAAEIYDTTSGTFKQTGTMDQAGGTRTTAFLAATLLPDGNVLVVGDYGTSVQLYNPATGTFTYTTAMNEPRTGVTVTLLPNGKVLVAGSSEEPSTELYDPATATWTYGPDMQELRIDHTASLLQDGTVLIAGGIRSNTEDQNSNNAERYDPDTNTFLPTGNLKLPRYNHTATLLPDGDVLLVGNGEGLVRTELYDHAAQGFVRTGNLSVRRTDFTATALPDGDVLIAGGLTNNEYAPRADRFDVATRTFTFTGSLNEPRKYHTATLLPNGKVLIAGGVSAMPGRAELYDPATGTFTFTGSLNMARYGHTATLLPNGKVLVAGGTGSNPLASAELYDPATGTWTTTGSMITPRYNTTATLLRDGTVLFAGGNINPSTATAEIYDPATGDFRSTGSLRSPRYDHSANLMPDGSVVVAGGLVTFSPETGTNIAISVERYDPSIGEWQHLGNLQQGRYQSTATSLDDGTVLYTGGQYFSQTPQTAELARLGHNNRFVGSLTIPTGWVGPTTSITFTGTTTGTALASGRLNDGPWVPATAGEQVVTTLQNGVDGRNRTITLWLRDAGDLSTEVVSGSADIDLTAPRSSMFNLPAISPPTVVLRWSGSDASSGVVGYDVEARDNGGAWTPVVTNTPNTTTTFDGLGKHRYEFRVRARDEAGNVEAWPADLEARTQVDPGEPSSLMTALPPFTLATFTIRWNGSDTVSGVAGYDVEVRDNGGAWTPVLTTTTALSTTFTGEHNHTYQFRVRATDGAGNVEAWPATFDAQTSVDTVAPEGAFRINDGALATTGVRVTLRLNAEDTPSGTADVRIALDGAVGEWQPFQRSLPVTLAAPDGDKFVGVQFRDSVGNVSPTITRTIRLDRSVDENAALLIDAGAVYTNVPTVTLTIGAPPNTAAMQISNNGTFTGNWLPFDTSAQWTITTFGTYTIPRNVYVRTRDIDGDVQDTAIDDIIYDPLPPTGAVTITNVTASTVGVRVAASDTVSEREELQMRLSTNPQFSGAAWQPYKATATVPRTGTDAVRVYAQFEDGAGNRSTVGCTTQAGGSCGISGGFNVFLPLVRR